MKWSELTNHTKLIDKIQDNGRRIDGQVVEYLVDRSGDAYLASAKSMWPIYQFDPNDYEIYTGDLAVGQYAP